MKKLPLLYFCLIFIQSIQSEEVAIEVNPEGQVGINLNGNTPAEGVDFHVRGRSHFENLLNLAPLTDAPESPIEGDIYLGSEGQLFLYLNSTWNILAQPVPIELPQPIEPYINLENYNLSFLDPSQNNTEGSTQVQVDQYTIHLNGNSWRKIDYACEILPNTILEFEFKSNNQGEVHGIGFTNSDLISSGVTFRLYGTQSWGISTYNDYSSEAGFWKSFSIPIGQFYQGQFNYLFFANDDDQSPYDGESFFRNIRLINND